MQTRMSPSHATKTDLVPLMKDNDATAPRPCQHNLQLPPQNRQIIKPTRQGSLEETLAARHHATSSLILDTHKRGKGTQQPPLHHQSYLDADASLHHTGVHMRLGGYPQSNWQLPQHEQPCHKPGGQCHTRARTSDSSATMQVGKTIPINQAVPPPHRDSTNAHRYRP